MVHAETTPSSLQELVSAAPVSTWIQTESAKDAISPATAALDLTAPTVLDAEPTLNFRTETLAFATLDSLTTDLPAIVSSLVVTIPASHAVAASSLSAQDASRMLPSNQTELADVTLVS